MRVMKKELKYISTTLSKEEPQRHKLLDQSLPVGGVFNQPKIMQPEDFGY
jgi:hypothetical protein